MGRMPTGYRPLSPTQKALDFASNGKLINELSGFDRSGDVGLTTPLQAVRNLWLPTTY